MRWLVLGEAISVAFGRPDARSIRRAVVVTSVLCVGRWWIAQRRRRRVQGGLSYSPAAGTEPAAAPIRVRRSVDAQLQEMLALIGRSIASGSSLALALSEAQPPLRSGHVHDALRAVELRTGQIGLVAALRQWGQDDASCRRVAWALAVAAETGGDPLAAIDALTDSLRADRSLERELGALTAQSRLSAAVLALVPIGFGALMTGTDERARAFLLSSGPGRACLTVGLVLDVVAWRWLRAIGAVAR